MKLIKRNNVAQLHPALEAREHQYLKHLTSALGHYLENPHGSELICVLGSGYEKDNRQALGSNDADCKVDKIGPTSPPPGALRSFPPTQQVNTRCFLDTVLVPPTHTPAGRSFNTDQPWHACDAGNLDSTR
jgi:hypothetical protein